MIEPSAGPAGAVLSSAAPPGAPGADLIARLVRLAPREGPVTVLKRSAGTGSAPGSSPVEPADRVVPPRPGTADAATDPQRAGGGVVVVRVGDVVLKAHPEGTSEDDLRARLDVAGRLPGLMLAPLGMERLDARLVTIWPAGEPLTPADLEAGDDDAPWEEGARLLARLHALPAPPELPPAGGTARLTRAVAALDGLPGVPPAIRAAYGTLPWSSLAAGRREPRPTATRSALVHGDWHLGQLVRIGGAWTLIDPDDLGWGDPAWDLARPAAWFASGLLATSAWDRFLGAYLAAGGVAVGPDDPWRELDPPARALTVQLAATAVATARRAGRPLDGTARALVSSCERILASARA
ncbi:phosphotransferase family protein [Microtetraspora niveoalba]|uniref:phosphotransferase family protein n=1 Tax=Microtetraspora niveoalba TaxID=46175 RepID=UPI0009FD97DA|nr:phosphotransferase [Microtetraspora niveoalba]